jgi:CRISPR-associated protein Cas5h
MNILSFDIWGSYAHYKKIYATTSALTYAIPPKTSLYGYIGAILGLEKTGNEYLKTFADKQCKLGIRVLRPIRMQRLGINLRPDRAQFVKNGKPTSVEFVLQPRYRIYFSHQNQDIYNLLKEALQHHTCVYTPTLGLASLISDFEWVEENSVEPQANQEAVLINSVIPGNYFLDFGNILEHNGRSNRIVEQSMVSIEMDINRNVTERDDILYDQLGLPIHAKVTEWYQLSANERIVLF